MGCKDLKKEGLRIHLPLLLDIPTYLLPVARKLIRQDLLPTPMASRADSCVQVGGRKEGKRTAVSNLQKSQGRELLRKADGIDDH